VEHVSRSTSLLHVEASRVRIFQFTTKLAEARRQVVHVPPSWMSREDEVKDGQIDAMGCIELCYHCFTIFYVLGSRGMIIF
jgi:hypothetical protein